jgi:hypothetical protein
MGTGTTGIAAQTQKTFLGMEKHVETFGDAKEALVKK